MGHIPSKILRQPPPPPRHHRSLMAANDEGGNTGMVGGNCTRTYYFTRYKRKRLMNIESFPDDLLFEILLHLPAQDIYDLARLVCWKWYGMIYTHNFIYAHLQHATYGLLFNCTDGKSLFMTVRQGQIEISKLSYMFRFLVWAGCNGLTLEVELRNLYILYISNPVTKQIFVLPPIFRAITCPKLCGIAYAAASMEYKVVVTYPPETDPRARPCAILTVGVDNSWRIVRTEHLPLKAMMGFLDAPLITEGFMHWVAAGFQVLTLNMETEIMTPTPAPLPQVYGLRRTYLSTGRYLSLLITCGESLWEVWEMKPETGEWRKLPDIALEAQHCTFKQFGLEHGDFPIPVGWLKYLEVLVFCVLCQGRLSFFFYNLLTKEIKSIELPTCTKNFRPIVHKNSLVWLAGC